MKSINLKIINVNKLNNSFIYTQVEVRIKLLKKEKIILIVKWREKYEVDVGMSVIIFILDAYPAK